MSVSLPGVHHVPLGACTSPSRSGDLQEIAPERIRWWMSNIPSVPNVWWQSAQWHTLLPGRSVAQPLSWQLLLLGIKVSL